jgi:hypothetical protein
MAYCVLCVEQKNYGKALQYYQQAHLSSPNHLLINYHYAQVLFHKSRRLSLSPQADRRLGSPVALYVSMCRGLQNRFDVFGEDLSRT